MNFNYCIPTKILFGAGKLNEIINEPLDFKKALIVITSGKSMRKFGYLERVQNLLKEKGIRSIVFDNVSPNPTKEQVMEGAAIARTNDCDVIIGLGGGSSIDTAKSIAVMASNEGDYWDYIFGGTGKGQPLKHKVLPIIAITTTAGTGTEADPWTVITNEATNEKIGFGTQETFPYISVVDPELMVSVPPMLTAYQGFGALFHAVEGYIANTATPISDIYALKSIELISKNLARVVENGNNIEARENVALANTLSGFVESTSSCTSEHSIEHALSAFHPELPHGAGLLMISEAYHSFFASKIPERYKDMAIAMGVDTIGMTSEEAAKSFVESLSILMKNCGVDGLKMSDYGITKDEFAHMITNARQTMGLLFTFDRTELSDDDVMDLLVGSYR